MSAAQAQNTLADSLRLVLKKHSQADTFRVNRLNELADLATRNDNLNDSLARQALALARKLQYAAGQGYALCNLASLSSEPKAMLALLQQALPLAKRSGDKQLLILVLEYMARQTVSTSWSGLTVRDRQRTFSAYQHLLTAARATQDPLLVARGTYFMSYYYTTTNNYAHYPLALRFGLESIRYAQQAHSAYSEDVALLMIGNSYRQLADYQPALDYILKARQKVRYIQEAELRWGVISKAVLQAAILTSLGLTYQRMGKYALAREAFQEALPYTGSPFGFYAVSVKSQLVETNEQLGSPKTLVDGLRVLATARKYRHMDAIRNIDLALGRYYLRKGRADSAVYYGHQVLTILAQFSNNLYARDAHLLLARAYAAQRQYPQAYRHQSRFVAYSASLTSSDVTRKAIATQFNDRMNRQQSQIRLLHKEKQLEVETSRRQRLLLLSSLVVLALLVGLAVVLYRNNHTKQRANALLQTQRDQIDQTLRELQATQNQLVQKEKMASLGELTAGIAHEIQNPLNFVNNFAEVSAELVSELRDEETKPERDRELVGELLNDLSLNLQKVSHHGGRASAIVRGMLEHSRTGAGEQRPTDLNALVEEYLKIAFQGLRAKDKGFSAKLTTNLVPGLAKLSIMPQELGRVLLNLYNNAFYAVQHKQKGAPADYQPSVSVSTARVHDRVEISIRDNGMGIAEAVKAKIFQPFFTTKPTGEGTGLGLSLAYDIITKGHGGTLSVTSQEGEGSEFTISLPVGRG